MSKKIQLSIPKPCHENWDAMTPVEKGKFCGSCAKEVVDFSTMNDRQVAEFFKKPSTGSVCGRFMVDQLERDIEIPKKRLPWFKYFFSIALPAFFFSKADAQNGQKMGRVKPATTDTIPTNIKHEYRTMGMVALPDKFIPVEKGTQKGVSGKVVDAGTNMPLPAAQIHLYSTIGKEKIYVQRDGSFIIDIYRKITVDRIEITLSGYIPQTLKLADFMKLVNAKEPIKLEREEMIVGKIAMVEYVKPVIGDTSITLLENEDEQDENISTINGRVIYDDKSPVYDAYIMIKGSKIGVTSNENGEFLIKAKKTDILLVDKAGSYRVEIPVKDWSYITVNLRAMVMGEVEPNDSRLVRRLSCKVGESKVPKKRTPLKTDQLSNINTSTIKQFLKPVIADFKVYPNPLTTGGSMTIEWKSTEAGYYSIELLNQSGQQVYQKEVWIDAEAKVLDLEIPNVPAGSYFLVMTNKKTGKKFSEKLVVQ